MNNQEAYERAKKRVEAKVGFYRHLTVYIAVCVLLIIINFITSSEYLWFIWPLMGWGFAIVVHALSVFGVLTARLVQTGRRERSKRPWIKSKDFFTSNFVENEPAMVFPFTKVQN